MHKRKVIILTAAMIMLVSGIAIAGSWGSWFTTSKKLEELPDVKDEYKKIMDQYINGTIINIGGIITLYDGEKNSAIKEQSAYRFIKQQDQFYTQLSYMQSFCNGKIVVQLDTVDHVIVVADAKKEMSKMKKAMQPSFDVLFNENADFKITGKITQNDKTERTIVFQDDFRPGIKSYELTYDPVTYKVKHAAIKWWKDGGTVMERTDESQVWVSKIEYQQQPEAGINISEEINKIITIKKDQVQPALKYQDYQLHVINPEQ